MSQFHEFFHILILKTCQMVEGHKYDQSISWVLFNLIPLEVPLACGGAVGSRTGGEHGREVDCWPPGLRESGPSSEWIEWLRECRNSAFDEARPLPSEEGSWPFAMSNLKVRIFSSSFFYWLTDCCCYLLTTSEFSYDFCVLKKISSVTKINHEYKLKRHLESIVISDNLSIHKLTYKQIVRDSNIIHFNKLFN